MVNFQLVPEINGELLDSKLRRIANARVTLLHNDEQYETNSNINGSFRFFAQEERDLKMVTSLGGVVSSNSIMWVTTNDTAIEILPIVLPMTFTREGFSYHSKPNNSFIAVIAKEHLQAVSDLIGKMPQAFEFGAVKKWRKIQYLLALKIIYRKENNQQGSKLLSRATIKYLIDDYIETVCRPLQQERKNWDRCTRTINKFDEEVDLFYPMQIIHF